MKLLKLLLLLPLFLFFSCGVKQTYISSNRIEDIGNKIGVEYSAEVGEDMVEYEEGRFFDAIVITSEDASITYHAKNKINKKQMFVHMSDIKGYSLYHSIDEDKPMYTYGVAIKKDGSETSAFISNDFGVKLYKTKTPIEYIESEYLDRNKEYFKQQFMYNGRSGNTIKFTYREYVNDMARAAFTQDLQYDLSESNIIGFKGMRIKVLKTSNINIDYVINKKFEGVE
ncbi:MAG: hypothetical protein BM557_01130 [Flavobacterium sp. MedPE-SWcel]|uniref:hypothetical protein n=1 Tax=uncultured Flavobacterium sp. TaxID=165435 RepID=UPI00091A2629|nr:hypothetical protein [uncultured Flavobacterium sp.]OIQ22010.1 MAG: hypothetical protein BM557_01130 [Flavobacterium sp. MedPE-SWcel]